METLCTYNNYYIQPMAVSVIFIFMSKKQPITMLHDTQRIFIISSSHYVNGNSGLSYQQKP